MEYGTSTGTKNSWTMSSVTWAVVTEGPAVGVSSGTTPPGHRDTATVETRFRHQHITMGTTGELLQAGDEAADGPVAVSPAD
ncbi:hypothetical protein EYF80_003408 [Liparis tanakae]|uniref:Uncharacterized protein n=1 Tax=Liparis tanakae TaxID=230148 RepID=A0A4Z2J9G3_9TELE|nr:hypothetical protein EYF80_003408 [Liparis tanakae]